MPPPLALLLTVGFVIYLFRRESREYPPISRALWLPIIWTVLISTRSVGQWLSVFGINVLGGSMEEGNPVDALIYLGFIVAGFGILARRRVSLGELVRNNRALTIYFIYCFLAVVWSDFPLVAFKRWTKILGHPVMALIVLTEPNPTEALGGLMRRCAYLLFPLSVTFIKYFIDIGRGFDDWGGASCNGVALNKNALGCICMLWTFYLFCTLLKMRHQEPSLERKRTTQLYVGLLLIIGWLVVKSQCATAVVCLIVGCMVVLAAGFKWVKPQQIGTYIMVAVILIALEEFFFGLSSDILALSGHNATLEGREQLWQELLNVNVNPLIGAGFESFWLGSRLDALWATHWWHPTEAHNGYLETYLHLGVVGVILLLILLFSVYRKAQVEMLRDFEFGRFKLGLLFAIIFYNWTEAAFKGLSPVWFFFLLIAIDYPAARVTVTQTLMAQDYDEEIEGPYAAGSA